MRSGRLRHRGRVERPVQLDRGESGQPRTGWETFAEVWADLASLTGREAQVAEQLSPRSTHIATIRWTPGVDATMRLVLRDDGSGRERTLGIDAVMDPKNRRDELQLLCVEAPALADPTGVAR